MNPARNDFCPCGSGKKFKKCCIDKPEFRPPAQALGKQVAPTQAEVDQIVALYGAGKKMELADQAKLLLDRCPDSGLAWKLWGATLQMLGKDSQPAMQKAAEFLPGDAEVHNFLGSALNALGRKEEAVASFRRALQINSKFAAALGNLGSVLSNMNELDEAEAVLWRAIKIEPNLAEAHHNLGEVLKKLGRLDNARQSAIRAVQIKPDYADGHYNLGVILSDLNQFGEAEVSIRKALAMKPYFVKAHCNLGNILVHLGRPHEAEASFRLAIQLDPNLPEAHAGLSLPLNDLGRDDEAEASTRLAIRLKPDFEVAHRNLGTILMDLGRMDEAEACFHRALQIDPNQASVMSKLGVLLMNLGRSNEAEAAFRAALHIQPDYIDAHNNLLSTLNFCPGTSGEEIVVLAREFDRRFCLSYKEKWPVHRNRREPDRRLRIGYVSPDFRHHAVAYFLEPILANHDKSRVEVFCYAEVKREDEYTDRFRKFADHWHSTRGLNDDAAAHMIHNHQIDILVDLVGHTAGNRLPVFARKPAPLQLTYLGYPGTTGLSAMDYRITDCHANPEGVADACYTERLLRLPNSLWCYRPTADMPKPSFLPALTNGFLTFGSFNNFNKIDKPTLGLWAELLKQIPTARLMMLTVPEGAARLRLTGLFAELGVDGRRLEFQGKLANTEFHRKFLEVDISLDPMNVNGATTTCESLWMGVPVLSLVGSRFLTRAGLSLLYTAGVPEFACSSASDYVRIAADLAGNLPRLAEIRAGLRARLFASPLTDEVGFTRNLENLYREIWKKWCGSV